MLRVLAVDIRDADGRRALARTATFGQVVAVLLDGRPFALAVCPRKITNRAGWSVVRTTIAELAEYLYEHADLLGEFRLRFVGVGAADRAAFESALAAVEP